jgi:hypothetical protein
MKLLAAAATLFVMTNSAAQAAEDAPSPGRWEMVRSAVVEATIAAEHAIMVGGVVIYRNRHMIAGAVLGCAAGSALATAPTLVLALPTAGGSLAAAPATAAIGCGVGGTSGAVLGYQLDHLD